MFGSFKFAGHQPTAVQVLLLVRVITSAVVMTTRLYFRGVRPFGVSLLIAGWDKDDERAYLYQCDPSVSAQQHTY